MKSIQSYLAILLSLIANIFARFSGDDDKDSDDSDDDLRREGILDLPEEEIEESDSEEDLERERDLDEIKDDLR